MGDLGLIPGSGRSPGEGNGYPLQYSSLENPMLQRVGQDLAAKHDIQVLWELGKDRKEQVIGKVGLLWSRVGKRTFQEEAL